MSQHDLNITDQTHTNFRQDLNSALEAIASKQSGSGDPTITYPFQEKIDTSVSPAVVYIRKSTNDVWVRIGYINASTGQLIHDNADTVDGKHIADLILKSGGNMTGTLNEAEGAAIASDSICEIWSTDGNTVHITSGVTPITSFGTAPQAGCWKKLIFDVAVTIKNGANLIVQGATDYMTATGDIAFIYADTTTQHRVVFFKADGMALKDSIPVGTVIQVAMNTAPAGYLKCNGAAIGRTTFSALFAAIGTTFGVGDGSTTFNLPELRSEFIRGWDDGRGVDVDRVFGSSQEDMFEAHIHGIQGFAYHYFSSGDSGGLKNITTDAYPVTSTGGIETRPRNIALLYCIKY